jgi:hypothetical protein
MGIFISRKACEEWSHQFGIHRRRMVQLLLSAELRPIVSGANTLARVSLSDDGGSA